MAIAIIDDSMTNLVILKQMTKKELCHPAVMFSDPRAAIDYLSGATSELIILDCDMPDIDGIAFIEIVRQMEHHKKTPILMVTCHSEPEVRLRALRAGGTDFLSKPIIPEEFKLRIRNLTEMNQLTPAAA